MDIFGLSSEIREKNGRITPSRLALRQIEDLLRDMAGDGEDLLRDFSG